MTLERDCATGLGKMVIGRVCHQLSCPQVSPSASFFDQSEAITAPRLVVC
jgi:hypothetical protein